MAKGSLEGVVQSINLSKATFGKIKQNLFWTFAYNVIAAGAMSMSSISVLLNALRLKRVRF